MKLYNFPEIFGEYIATEKYRSMLSNTLFTDLHINKEEGSMSALLHVDAFQNIIINSHIFFQPRFLLFQLFCSAFVNLHDGFDLCFCCLIHACHFGKICLECLSVTAAVCQEMSQSIFIMI